MFFQTPENKMQNVTTDFTEMVLFFCSSSPELVLLQRRLWVGEEPMWW